MKKVRLLVLSFFGLLFFYISNLDVSAASSTTITIKDNINLQLDYSYSDTSYNYHAFYSLPSNIPSGSTFISLKVTPQSSSSVQYKQSPYSYTNYAMVTFSSNNYTYGFYDTSSLSFNVSNSIPEFTVTSTSDNYSKGYILGSTLPSDFTIDFWYDSYPGMKNVPSNINVDIEFTYSIPQGANFNVLDSYDKSGNIINLTIPSLSNYYGIISYWGYYINANKSSSFKLYPFNVNTVFDDAYGTVYRYYGTTGSFSFAGTFSFNNNGSTSFYITDLSIVPGNYTLTQNYITIDYTQNVLDSINDSLHNANGSNSSLNNSNSILDSTIGEYDDVSNTDKYYDNIDDSIWQFDSAPFIQVASTLTLYSSLVTIVWNSLGDFKYPLIIFLTIVVVRAIIGLSRYD